jgi:outer membrane protein OmpA-like peptidoglycan-associated protein
MSRRRVVPAASIVAAAVAWAALAAPARADRTAAFDAEQFHPAPTSQGYFAVDGAWVAPHLGFSAGLFLSYAHDPLVLRRPDTEALVSNKLGGDLVASFALVRRLEIAIDLPFAYQLAHGDLAGLTGVDAGGIGDLKLEGKFLLWAPSTADGLHDFGLSLVIGATAPTGNSSSFLGQGAFTGFGHLVGEWRSRWASIALNFGGVGRTRRDFGALHVTSQLSWGVGLAVPLPLGFAMLGEARGLIGVALPAGASLSLAETPAELTVGARFRAPFGLEVLLGGGTGLTRGYGTPDGRVIAGIRYVTPDRGERRRAVVHDRDGDQVPDDRDNCPDERGPAANQGCPDRDQDGDGVADRVDQCPSEPGPAVTHGCPDPDGDGDGVPDRLDKCPLDKGVRELAGCPRPDRDRDGVPDAEDRCPDRAGVPENQGCPDFDSDGDGFVDRNDKCPFDPETFNGVDDDDGCPDKPAALAVFTGERIAIFEPVVFEKEGAVIDKRSFKLLGVIAQIMNLHGEVLKFRIEGHLDNRGDAFTILDLSRARAAAVRRWLIEHGRGDARRLSAPGFGADRPIADNKDAAGRAKNRRIDIVVMQKLDNGP